MDFKEIYQTGADGYDALVGAEDADGNLSPALTDIMAIDGRRVVEVGAGTGRVTRLLSDAGATVTATEFSAAMLDVADRSLGARDTVQLCQADAMALPIRDGAADVAVAGWVLGHQCEWAPNRWRDTIGTAIDEMVRVTGSDGSTGAVIIIETLGTGHTEPFDHEDLRRYYDWLEGDLGFSATWIRTDYEFPDVETAAAVTGDFFGQEMADLVRRDGLNRVPECTGIWWRI